MARTRSWGIAVALIVLGWTGCSDDGSAPRSPGALDQTAFDGEVVTSMPLDIGQVALVGGPDLVNDSGADAFVEEVELVGRSDGLEVVGWVLMDRTDVGIGAIVGSFPPPGARALGDGRVAPTRTRNQHGELVSDVQVVIGLRPIEPGRQGSSSVLVTYSDATGRHSVEVSLAYEICGLPADDPTSCE